MTYYKLKCHQICQKRFAKVFLKEFIKNRKVGGAFVKPKGITNS